VIENEFLEKIKLKFETLGWYAEGTDFEELAKNMCFLKERSLLSIVDRLMEQNKKPKFFNTLILLRNFVFNEL